MGWDPTPISVDQDRLGRDFCRNQILVLLVINVVDGMPQNTSMTLLRVDACYLFVYASWRSDVMRVMRQGTLKLIIAFSHLKSLVSQLRSRFIIQSFQSSRLRRNA